MRCIAKTAVTASILFIGCLTFHLCSGTAQGQTLNTARGVEETLREQLKVGLKARREVEFEYIETVAKRVENETLPLELVRSTFLWARRKKPYPFQYFQRGLRIRATRMGITAP